MTPELIHKARELLAAEWAADGRDDMAMLLVKPELGTVANPAIRAIAKALQDTARLDWIESKIQEYGDGRTEPREAGWAIDWRQEKPDDYWPGLRVWLDSQRELCFECQGSGRDILKKSEACPWCEGVGRTS